MGVGVGVCKSGNGRRVSVSRAVALAISETPKQATIADVSGSKNRRTVTESGLFVLRIRSSYDHSTNHQTATATAHRQYRFLLAAHARGLWI